MPDALHPEGAQAVAPPDGADQGEPREPRRESDSGAAIFWLPSWPMNEPKSPSSPGTDFIRQVVKADVASARYGGRVITRFPPEPNGYLHVGHAMGICLNFGIANEFGGCCHLRYDDTNPDTERKEYVEAIQEDIRWLGFDWGQHLYFASDYFERMYECGEVLIKKGLAYVDSQATEVIREGRGTVTESGVPSPYRNRSSEENLDLFRGMRAGEFGDGEHVLRGKIDMASPNMLMRDPVFYRIRHASHYRRGDDWCIYPLYDYAHCLEDAFEGVTHSICTLEFDNNRELYNWVLENVGFEEPRSHQYEWAGLDLENAVLSKRKIAPLVEGGFVSGWDDPRLATLAAYRRRGIPPEAIRLLSELVGVSKTGAQTEATKLDFAIRRILNQSAPRVMAVLDPIRVVIANYPKGKTEEFEAPYYPHDVPLEGSRTVPFSHELWIERADFLEHPPKGFRRLMPGGEVRLRYAYVIRCDEVIKDDAGRILEVRCTYDPDTRGGSTSDGRKVKGTIQWVSVPHGVAAEARLFDHLFFREVGEDQDSGAIGDCLNPDSLTVISDMKIEPSILTDPENTRYQFERTGYFWRDPIDGCGDQLVFNRIVSLKDAWAKRDTKPSPNNVKAKRPAQAYSRTNPEASKQPRIPSGGEQDAEALARMVRYTGELGVGAEQAEILAQSLEWSSCFESALTVYPDAAALATWIVNDLRGLLGGRSPADLPFTGKSIGELASLVEDGGVSRRAAKDVLARLIIEGGDPKDLVDSMGLRKVTDTHELSSVVKSVVDQWEEKAAEYRAGKSGLLGFFVGEVMKKTGGAADPEAAKSLLQDLLDN